MCVCMFVFRVWFAETGSPCVFFFTSRASYFVIWLDVRVHLTKNTLQTLWQCVLKRMPIFEAQIGVAPFCLLAVSLFHPTDL